MCGGMWGCVVARGGLWWVYEDAWRVAREMRAYPTEGISSWYASWECCTKRGIAWSVDGVLREEGEGS